MYKNKQMEAHHHHNTAASRTQEQSVLSTAQSSPSSTLSHTNIVPSIGAVPTTTAGPITISIVVALTLVICMILNCGKLKRRVSPQRYNVQQQHQPQQQEIYTDKKTVNSKSMRPPMNVQSPSSRCESSPWSSSSTLLSPQTAPAHVSRQLHDDPSHQMQNQYYQPQPPLSRVQPLSHSGPSPR
ncbi:unnamed protein product [Absidia cylindrospora]